MRPESQPDWCHALSIWMIVALTVSISLYLPPAAARANPCPCDSARPNGATYENIRIFPSDRDQVEPSIAAYGAGTQKLIIGAITASRGGCQENPVGHRQGTYLSSDGGITWNGYDTLPRSLPGGVDPAVAFGPGGRAYHDYCCNALQWQADTGGDWSIPVDVTPNTQDDRPHMVIDLSSSSP